MDELIPEEALAAARLKLKRKIAAVLISAMADSGLSVGQMDARLGQKSGFVMGAFNLLIAGLTADMNLVSDIALSMGCELDYTVVPYQPPRDEWAIGQSQHTTMREAGDA